MSRAEVLKSPDYWMQKWQIEIYRIVNKYWESEKGKVPINFGELQQMLNIPSYRLRLILSGDFNGSIYDLIDVLLKCGHEPSSLLNELNKNS